MLASHGTVSSHSFISGSTLSYVYTGQIQGADPQGLFYKFFSCANGNYEASAYLAGEYVFGTSKGLLSVASSKSGGMWELDGYYSSLAQGKTFGQAMLNWWTARGPTYDDADRDWYYGMTLLGDPTLVLQRFVPEPATAVLLWLGATLLLRRRARDV